MLLQGSIYCKQLQFGTVVLLVGSADVYSNIRMWVTDQYKVTYNPDFGTSLREDVRKPSDGLRLTVVFIKTAHLFA